MNKLAVKYRPTDFDEVVGQDINCDILEQQLENNDISNGYLFSGGSGIGKTTVARIMANYLDAEAIEIDGASNNSVDNIREIRSDTRLKSITNQKKVYIIDEAHQLSNSAFQALLKTLEEPPEDVIFILATTEPDKIISTVRTRVQHFKFTRVSWKDIKERLDYILEEQGQDHMDDNAVEYISKLADGSVREAIKILERVLLSSEPVTLEHIAKLAGDVNYLIIYRLFKALFENKDPKELVEHIENVYNDGVDMKNFADKLAKFSLELAKYGMFDSFEYIKVPHHYKSEMDEMLEMVVNSDYKLRDLFNIFNELSNDLKYESDPKLLIEGELLQLL